MYTWMAYSLFFFVVVCGIFYVVIVLVDSSKKFTVLFDVMYVTTKADGFAGYDNFYITHRIIK